MDKNAMELIVIKTMRIFVFLFYLLSILHIAQGSVRIIEPNKQTIWLHTGSDVVLKCVATHGHRVSWYHDNRLLHQNLRRSITTQPPNARNQRISELRISDLREEDGGVISCKNNRHSSESDDVTMFVSNQNRFSTVEIVEPDSPVLRKAVGEEIMLKCMGRKGEELEWLHNGTVLQTGSKLVITSAATSTNKQVTLMSRISARAHDAGNYECRTHTNVLDRDVVQVIVESSSSASDAGVEITSPRSSPYYIPPKTSLHIGCSAPHATQVHWFKNNIRVLNGEHGYSIQESIDHSTNRWFSWLRKHRVNTDEVYKCQNVHNTLDYDVVEIRVNRSGSSRRQGKEIDYIATRSVAVPMNMHSSLQLECRIDAIGTYLAQWAKGNQTIHASGKYNIATGQRSSKLTIRRTVRDDTGLYTCSFTHATSGQVSGAIVYNVSGILCPALESSSRYRITGCPAIQYVGERCEIACKGRHMNTINASGFLTCWFDETRREAYWSDSSHVCDASAETHGGTGGIQSSMSDVLLRANENLALQCRTSRITWVKSSNHLPITNNQKYEIQDGTLIIKNAGAKDAGIYTCMLHAHDGSVFGHKNYNVTVMPCPKLEIPQRGGVIGCPRDAVYGDTCEYTCQPGAKHVSGSRLTTCELNGEQTDTYWTGTKPVCQDLSHSSSFQDDPSAAASNLIFHSHRVLLCIVLWLTFYLYR